MLAIQIRALSFVMHIGKHAPHIGDRSLGKDHGTMELDNDRIDEAVLALLFSAVMSGAAHGNHSIGRRWSACMRRG